MKKITTQKFEMKCLKILEEVRITRQPLLIYKGRKIVAKLPPFGARPEDFFGCLADVLAIIGDIESALWPTEV